MTPGRSDGPATVQRGYRLVVPQRSEPVRVLPDEDQRRVIDHVSGPLLVVGGPGTGKTTTLVESVAARVAEGVDPERILVVTFGRRGALGLRERIEARMVRPAQPLVRTFHGYAFGLLYRAAVAAGDEPPRLLTGPEQDLVIRELLSSSAPEAMGWPEPLRPALKTRAFATELRDLLLRCAERGLGPAGLAELARQRRRADWLAASRFFREYRRVLALREATVRGRPGYDYAELVAAATRLLRDNPDLLLAERHRLAHVYVDEFADTDPAQIELLETIAAGGAHCVTFADPDSSIFAFRGADPGIIDTFAERFPMAGAGAAVTGAATSREVVEIMLTTSYRSDRSLLAATRRVATRLRGPMRHRHLRPATDCPATTASPSMDLRTFGTAAREASYVAHRLREAHLIDGVPWSAMAVIIRSSVLYLSSVRRALIQAGVPTVVQAEDLPLHLQPAVASLLLLLRCALDPGQLTESTAVALLHSPIGGADPLAERQLRQGLRALAFAGKDRRPSGDLLVEVVNDPAALSEVDRCWATPARTLAAVLAATRAAAPAGIERMLWAAWSSTGLADRWAAASAAGGPLGEAADRDLDAVVALFDAAARFADRLPGAGPAVFVEYIEGQDLPADRLAPVADRGPAVRLLTAHTAKGLEWDVVAVVGVQEGIWPDLRLRGSVLGSEMLVDVIAGREMETVGRLSALLDEERRLFYVATTRARRRLIVTAVEAGDVDGQPSRFLWELGASVESSPRPGDEVGAGVGAGVGDGAGDARPARSLTLPALVGRLRAALADPGTPEVRRAAAARLLAQCWRQGVPGADPDQWWGLPALSDAGPLVSEGQSVRVTPSTVESIRRCALRWLLERHGGSVGSSPEQGIGNLVHAAAMLATSADVDRAVLASYVAERFDSIELSARWLAGRERERTDA
ncbi:MAG: ATP-dependent helicase, partial [Micromonosporaceae bacterium]|nr:ATP-dependent helicase [Micromonosporaceae bacterium]